MNLTSRRLILRGWEPRDYLPFARMNADPAVMRYFPNVLSHEESEVLFQRLSCQLRQDGIGYWAIESAKTGQFIGTVGFKYVKDKLPCAPFYEIGWRIDRPYWRKGFAYEAAECALKFAFDQAKLNQIFSMTMRDNLPSWRLMEKLGMQRLNLDFQHPEVPKDHDCSWHYLYRITHGCLTKHRLYT